MASNLIQSYRSPSMYASCCCFYSLLIVYTRPHRALFKPSWLNVTTINPSPALLSFMHQFVPFPPSFPPLWATSGTSIDVSNNLIVGDVLNAHPYLQTQTLKFEFVTNSNHLWCNQTLLKANKNPNNFQCTNLRVFPVSPIPPEASVNGNTMTVYGVATSPNNGLMSLAAFNDWLANNGHNQIACYHQGPPGTSYFNAPSGSGNAVSNDSTLLLCLFFSDSCCVLQRAVR